MSEMHFDLEIKTILFLSPLMKVFNAISRQILLAFDFFDVKIQKRKAILEIYVITLEK